MFRYLLFVFLLSCAGRQRYAGPDLVSSESPCVDGTLVNMDQAGCEMVYFGYINSDQNTLKIRCTYSKKKNLWTQVSFYVIPNDYPLLHANWFQVCRDMFVTVYFDNQGMLISDD